MNLLKTLFLATALCSATVASAADLIDINTASAKVLATAISGVGESRAAEIIAYRTQFGPFKSVDDLVMVKGIGQATVDGSRDKLTVHTD